MRQLCLKNAMQLHNNSLQQLRPGSCNCNAAAKSPDKLMKRVWNVKSWGRLGEKGGPTSIQVKLYQSVTNYIYSPYNISICIIPR